MNIFSQNHRSSSSQTIIELKNFSKKSENTKLNQNKKELVTADKVKEYLREPFILYGYRTESNSFLKSFWGLFEWHNQTGEIWSHFLSLIIYFFLGLTCLQEVPKTSHDIFIFLTYFFGVFICFGTSTVFHLFGNYSKSVRTILLAFDRSGIVIVFLTSTIFLNWYGFYCYPLYQFISVSISSSVSIVILAIIWSNHLVSYTLVGFLGMFTVGLVSTLCIIYVTNYWDLITRFSQTYLCYTVGTFFYVTKFPECKYPGVFDLKLLKSHVLWHVMISLGAFNFFPLVMECFEYFSHFNVC